MKNTPKRLSKEWFAEQGRKGGKIGGAKVKALYGTQHFSKIAKKRVDKLKNKKKA